MNDKNTDKLDSAVEPISIVETTPQVEKNAALTETPISETKEVRAVEGLSEKQIKPTKLNYWSIIEFLLAFATPFFMETLIIWFVEAVFPYHRPDFAVLTPITTAFLMVSATRIVPPIIGLLLAVVLSKCKFREPKSILLLWFSVMTAFIFGWVLYCRTVNTYWL